MQLRLGRADFVEDLVAPGERNKRRDDLGVVEDIDARESAAGVPAEAFAGEHVGVASGRDRAGAVGSGLREFAGQRLQLRVIQLAVQIVTALL